MHYSTAVLTRLRDPKFAGWLPKDAVDVGTGEAGTLEEGAVTRIQLRIADDGARIAEAVFKVFGCSAAIASASLVAERLQNASMAEATSLDPLTVVAELELPMERAYVAALAVRAVHAAIDDWKRKNDRNL